MNTQNSIPLGKNMTMPPKISRKHIFLENAELIGRSSKEIFHPETNLLKTKKKSIEI